MLLVAVRAAAEPAERHRLTGVEVVQMDWIEVAPGRGVYASRALRFDGAAFGIPLFRGQRQWFQ